MNGQNCELFHVEDGLEERMKDGSMFTMQTIKMERYSVSTGTG